MVEDEIWEKHRVDPGVLIMVCCLVFEGVTKCLLCNFKLHICFWVLFCAYDTSCNWKTKEHHDYYGSGSRRIRGASRSKMREKAEEWLKRPSLRCQKSRTEAEADWERLVLGVRTSPQPAGSQSSVGNFLLSFISSSFVLTNGHIQIWMHIWINVETLTTP